MEHKPLSKRQRNIMAFIERFLDQRGYPPTIREIGEAVDIASTSVVNYNLNKLERLGLIARDREVSRGLRITSQIQPRETQMVSVPLVGRIVASEPVPVPGSDFSYFGADETIELTTDIVESSKDLFALQVKGDSMVDAMINDGDIVILRPHRDVKDGDLVAVWLEDREETTLKYIHREGERIRLQPANPTMEPIYINNPGAVQVQGRVVAVVRRN